MRRESLVLYKSFNTLWIQQSRCRKIEITTVRNPCKYLQWGFYQEFNVDKKIDVGLAEKQKKIFRKFTSMNTVVFTSLRSQQTTDRTITTANEQFCYR
jgi:hypothetical protein